MFTQTSSPSASQSAFPATQWSKLAAARGELSSERRAALNFLIERYLKPVFCYVRRCGRPEEEAKDLVQEFFTVGLQNELFAKADPARGRFRNFLLKSLNHFMANAHRAEHAHTHVAAGH